MQLREAARLSWYKLFKKTKESFVRKWQEVSKGKAEYPECAENILGILTVDSCGNLQPLFQDDFKNLIPAPPKKCKCQCDECACSNVTDSLIQKDVVINGDSYTNKYYTRVAGNVLIEESEEWVAFYDLAGTFKNAQLVKNQKTHNLKTEDCGCISSDEENIKTLTNCGCISVQCAPSLRLKYPNIYNKYGYYKLDENKKEIHVFDTNGKRSKLEHIIVSYQSNGEDMLVPDYAESALVAMLDWYKKMYSDVFTPSHRIEAKRNFIREKNEMLRYLFPVPYQTISESGAAWTVGGNSPYTRGFNECTPFAPAPQTPIVQVVQSPTVVEKVIKETIIMDNYKVIAGKVDGSEGSPQAGTYIYQNDLIKNAINLQYMIVNKNQETIIDGDFTVDFSTGTITRTNQWLFGDTFIIPLTKNT